LKTANPYGRRTTACTRRPSVAADTGLILVVAVIVVIVVAKRGKIVSVAAGASSCLCTTHWLVDAGKEPAGG
jgi:hypothetical protein